MRSFHLEVLTPERRFLDEKVELVSVEACDGRLTVLAGHTPMVAPITDGILNVQMNGMVKRAFHAAGFLEVRPDQVLVFAQTCEWPEEIDLIRAKAALEKANEQLRQKQSILEHKRSEMALSRAMARLRLKR